MGPVALMGVHPCTLIHNIFLIIIITANQRKKAHDVVWESSNPTSSMD
jgi:hypothetical protein